MEYLHNTDHIRNICILAHVDHGKTTIADSLIASNGIISQRIAGKMRYLDNLPDEQERGITMKSSCIALKFCNNNNDRYLINLVDTPGHVDFCGEVSAAVRLCDGALIVVDVVEGVCPQTKVALEQAWKEGIEPILVLNKLDRLILEEQLDETTAYLRLQQILEQINAIVATLLTTEVFEYDYQTKTTRDVSKRFTESEAPEKHIYDWASAIENIDDDKYYFVPEKENVLFASAIDGWAFTIGSFAKILSSKHKINLSALQKTLWGDYYIDLKQKRILPNAQAKAKRNLFTSMVLENIWRVYDAVAVRKDKIKMAKICEVLNIELTTRDLNHTDPRFQTKLIMNKWLHLSNNVLDCVAKIIPDPSKLSEKRVERLLSSNFKRFDQLHEKTKSLKKAFLDCSPSETAIKVACVSKLIPFERKNMPEFKRNVIRIPNQRPEANSTSCLDSSQALKSPDADHKPVFLAFARVFSGKLKKGDQLYVLGPKHDPSLINDELIANIDSRKTMKDLGLNEHVTLATLNTFYLLMGRDIEEIDCALAGNIVGLLGLEDHLIRTATLSNDLFCPPFNDLHLPAAPILRVAIEPKNPTESQILARGLKLLNQADPCIEVRVQDTGEHVIIATGEVHLQHCIKDLKERYTNIELNISPPIVPFRETIVLPPRVDMVNEVIDDSTVVSSRQLSKKGIIEMVTPNKQCKIRIQASSLPENVLKYLIENAEKLKLISKMATSKHRHDPFSIDRPDRTEWKKLETFKSDLQTCFNESRSARPEWRNLYQDDLVGRIWSFGPKHSGPNLLVAGSNIDINYSQWSRICEQNGSIEPNMTDLGNYVDSFISGFQLATQFGPLCEEPMMGVCFTIVDWLYVVDQQTLLNSTPDEIDDDNFGHTENLDHQRDNFGPLSGQIISTVKDCCRRAFQAQPQRLMSPMFSCDIQVTTDVLGKMYAVMNRRHGRVLHGDMREGSQTFEIKAFIPVIESLDFVGEIRKQTSGMANPQLIFSHYEIIDMDPFWTPKTEEEYALYGEKADTENRARKYMNLVRQRKGLNVSEKTVEHGEKQRTIKRNK